MKLNLIKRFGTTLAVAVGLFWMAGATSTTAEAFWPAKCESGYTLKAQSNASTKFRCRKRIGTRFISKAGKCFIPTPYLTKHTHLGRNYSCGVQVGTTTVWNKFRCTGSGYRVVKNATSKGKTCRKPRPKYRYVKPTF